MRDRWIGTAFSVALALAGASCGTQLEMDHFTDTSAALPGDALFRKLWGLKRIQAVQAWTRHRDCSTKIVAVVDSGVDIDHEDLKDNIWINAAELSGAAGVDDDGNSLIDDVRGWNFYDNNNDPKDGNLHGTHVAGTIGAVGGNGVGVVGICPKARIMAIRAMGPDGSGAMSDIASGILYATVQGAKVINLSLGGPDSAVVHSAIQSARSAGVLVIAAAGNDSSNLDSNPMYPAAYTDDNLIRVAATSSDDKLASFSNYGATVDIAAPGKNILSTFPTYVTDMMVMEEKTHDYELLDGTSMATPHVAGAAALVWSHHPTWTYLQVKAWLLDHAEAISSLDGLVAGSRRLRLGDGI